MKIARIVVILPTVFLLMSCITYGDAERLRISDFSDFESWHKVNPESLIGPADGLLQGRHLEEGGMREVYVNSVGRSVSDGETELPFPEGSIVLKDTYYIDRDGGRGRRWNITVMRKRAEGYDSENGDWEYVTAGPTKFIRLQGRAPLCIECHVYAEDRDYVFTWPE